MTNATKLIAIALVAVAATAGAQTSKGAAPAPKTQTAKITGYKKDLPDSLVRQAKVAEATAAATALAKVPNGKISTVELEREGGKLLYSYDIAVAGKTGIDEVQVDAMTGTIIGKAVHESPAAEKKEAAGEAKEKAVKTAPIKKKPPV